MSCISDKQIPRRAFMRNLGATVAFPLLSALPTGNRMAASVFPGAQQVGRGKPGRVVIAGGGIIGASIAYHLAVRGADVTLLEKEAPAAGATGQSFAWINAGRQPYSYHLLSIYGMSGWRRLERESKRALHVRWGGKLEWCGEGEEEAAKRLREQVRRHNVWGYPMTELGADELRRLEENIEPGTVLAAFHTEEDGSVDPVQVVYALLKMGAEAGARILYPAEVTGLEAANRRLRRVHSTAGDFEAEALVVACGADTPHVAAMAGLEVPLGSSAAFLAHTKPLPALVNRVVYSPGGHLKQKLDGRIVVGPKTREAEYEAQQSILAGRAAGSDPSREHGERLLADAARFLPKLRPADLERVTLGRRPLPADGQPVVGFHPSAPDVYVAAMHSGISLAPVIGRLAAIEILDRVDVELLEPYRLTRFKA